MAKVNVEVTHAVVSGKGHGEHLQLDETSAKRLERIGYVRVLGAVNAKETATKTQTKAKTGTKDTKKKAAQSKRTKDAKSSKQ